MKVILIRHAPTAGNLQSNYVGSTDEPLAPEGVRLAESVGSDGSVKIVHTSALLRAKQTAGILFPNARLVVHPDLNEMNFGDFEGKNWKELENDPRYAAWLETNCDAPCPGGESKVGFSNRCQRAFLEIVNNAAPDDEVRIVTHGGVIMAVMSAFAEPERDYFSWRAGHCEGYVVESKRDGDFRGRDFRLSGEDA